MMKEQIIQKLTSRKFWVAVVGVVVGLAAAFGINDNDYASIVGVIGSIASAITYICAESNVDKAATQNQIVVENTVKGDVDNA